MGFRFSRRVKILPGVTLNFSKSGISTSVGAKGARVTFGGKRGSRATIGIPGTGIHYTAQEKRTAAGPTEKVVTCPRCKKTYLFDERMIGEELICTCRHKFYLSRNVKTVPRSAVKKTAGSGCMLVLAVPALIFALEKVFF